MTPPIFEPRLLTRAPTQVARPHRCAIPRSQARVGRHFAVNRPWRKRRWETCSHCPAGNQEVVSHVRLPDDTPASELQEWVIFSVLPHPEGRHPWSGLWYGPR